MLPALLSACGAASPADVVRPGGVEPAEIELPSQILGMTVTREEPAEDLKDISRSYFDAIALFSLREGELVRASLQIARFNSLARPRSRSFRAEILGKIGSVNPEDIRVGEDTVYYTAGNRQNIFVWFRGRGLFVLITHQEYKFARTLLRRLIEQELTL